MPANELTNEIARREALHTEADLNGHFSDHEALAALRIAVAALESITHRGDSRMRPNDKASAALAAIRKELNIE